MIFDNKPISEITNQELKDLIGNQEENLWIDFKQQDYHRDPEDPDKRRREICKDVTAMANADGGYILIGVDEKNKIAQDFFTVPDAAKVAQSIKSICLQYIDAPILNLEVERYPYPLQWKNTSIELVIIHIPPSERKPHGFRSKGTINFVKRDGDATREYAISELIQDLLVSYHPPIMSQIDSKLAAILNNTQVDRRSEISSQDDALEHTEVGNLLHLMKLRFDESISNQPYYRILAVPRELNQDAVDIRSEHIRNILQYPPNIRRLGFGVRGMMDRDIVPSSEGIKGRDMYREITFLKNGFLEVRCPLSDSHFQWRHDEARISTPWLYPYVVCEFPVSFLKLAKAVYEVSGINSSILVQQNTIILKDYADRWKSIRSLFRIIYEDDINVYEGSIPIVSKRTVNPDFVPDHVAYELVKEVYDCFKLDDQCIPAFDEKGNFILQ